MSAKKKTAFDHMVEAAKKADPEAPGLRVAILTNASGNVSAISQKSAPTREDFIDGWMRTPSHTQIGRDANGCIIYDVHHYTREEAERKVDRYLASLRADAP